MRDKQHEGSTLSALVASAVSKRTNSTEMVQAALPVYAWISSMYVEGYCNPCRKSYLYRELSVQGNVAY